MYKIAQKRRIDKNAKKNIVQQIKNDLSLAKGIIIINYQGTTVEQFTQFRRDLAKHNAKVKVVKNRLLELAIKNSDFEEMKTFIHNAIAVVSIYNEDNILNAIKCITEHTKQNEKLKVVGGYLYKQILNSEKIKDIANLPSKEQLVEKAIYLISTPLRRLYLLLQSPLYSLVNLISIKSKN
ncbi:MAG: 50S ribosomal protein L10 [Endomicrobia bacterium]|nr:50S ribosomal protein L10 [Endomicrobiia bacterium]